MQQCWFRTLVCRESLTLELWIKFWHARFLSGTHGVILQGADTWFVHNYRFLDSAMSPRIRSVASSVAGFTCTHNLVISTAA